MPPFRILGIFLILAGWAVALVTLGSYCYAVVIPGLPTHGPSCDQSVLFGAAGLAVALVGVVLVFSGWRLAPDRLTPN
jgi:hypothetical protein